MLPSLDTRKIAVYIYKH